MKQIIIIAFSILVGLLSILFRDPIWDKFGINDPVLKTNLAVITSYFLIFTGFLFVIVEQLESVKKNISQTIRETITKELKFMNHFNNPTFHQGISGLNFVTEKLNSVTKVLNTRVIPLKYNGTLYTGEATRWNRSIANGVKAGIEFVDVVCGQGNSAACAIAKELSQMKGSVKGRYEAFQVNVNLMSFLNFKVLTFKDGSKEVWVGWRVSNTSSINEPCFRSADTNMIKLFEDWHRDLVASGNRIAQFPFEND